MTNKKKRVDLHLLELFRYILVFLLLIIIFLTFLPSLLGEIKYDYVSLKRESKTKTTDNENKTIPEKEFGLIPPNYNFSIVIPKIEVTAPVFSNTDPFNEREFRKVLKEGVAHAKDTAFPGEVGNSFIFAHSTNIFDNVSKYNAIFYLIGKLEKGDLIELYYKNQRFVYTVYDKKVVPADAVQYLNPLEPNEKTLTLSTCYPPGTTWKRLLVISKTE